jgi:hypothetical protein
MSLGEYLDSLEERTAKLRLRYKNSQGPLANLLNISLNMASEMLPAARQSMANLYTSLDNLDKSLQTFEKLD